MLICGWKTWFEFVVSTRFHSFPIFFCYSEDLLGDDLGDQSLADYNLGNEEEEQLLADDYESGTSQNVPTSISSYGGVVGNIYSGNDVPSQVRVVLRILSLVPVWLTADQLSWTLERHWLTIIRQV